MDAPDPLDVDHEHLFGHHDTTRALVELRRPGGAQPVLAACVLCGLALDLAETLRGTTTARRDRQRDSAGREAVRETTTPTTRSPPGRAELVPGRTL